MTAIRIQLGGMPRLLAEIIDAALMGEKDFVVAKANPAVTHEPIAVGTDCDVLLVCPEFARDPGIAMEPLAEGHPPSIVALLPHGKSATILRFTRESWPVVTSSDLCAALRRAAPQSWQAAG